MATWWRSQQATAPRKVETGASSLYRRAGAVPKVETGAWSLYHPDTGVAKVETDESPQFPLADVQPKAATGARSRSPLVAEPCKAAMVVWSPYDLANEPSRTIEAACGTSDPALHVLGRIDSALPTLSHGRLDVSRGYNGTVDPRSPIRSRSTVGEA